MVGIERLMHQVMAGAVDPLLSEFTTGTRVANADRHGPSVGSKHPSLDQFRLGVCAVNGLRRCRETAPADDVPVAFSDERQFSHGLPFRFFGGIPANTSSSLS